MTVDCAVQGTGQDGAEMDEVMYMNVLMYMYVHCMTACTSSSGSSASGARACSAQRENEVINQ